MTTVGVLQPRGHQRPQDRPTLYWSERQGTWWPGVSRRCPACQGTLYAVPPGVQTRVGFTPGRVACLLCEREWADVLDVRRRNLTAADLEPAPRGRPPTKRRTPVNDPAERPCLDCTEHVAVINRNRCRACSKAHRETGRAGSLFRRVMTPGLPMERVVLQRILGLTRSGLASAIERARSHGVRLTTTSRGWLTLEAAP